MRIKPRHLLRLYPRQWRARYGDEFVALLEREGTTSRVVLNVLAGAFDAWMSPRTPGAANRVAAPAGPMGPQILLLQPNKGPRSASEIWSQFYFGAAAFVSLLGLSVLLHAASNDSWLADTLQRHALGVAFGMSWAPSAFRDYPKRTQLAGAVWMGLVSLGVLRFLTWLWP